MFDVLFRFPVFTAAAIFLPTLASAYEVSLTPAGNGKEVVLISGEILEDETPKKLLDLVKSSGVDTVSFDSEGGNIMAALELGRAIRKAGLDTYQEQGRECASACSLLFVSGVNRRADDQVIGVHQSWFDTEAGIDMEEAVSVVQELTADMLTYLIEMGVDPKLLQLSLTTPSDDMHYLSTDEMVALKVVTAGEDGTRIAAYTSGSPDEDSTEAEELIEEVVEQTRRRVGEERVEVKAVPKVREASVSQDGKRSVTVRALRKAHLETVK